MIRWSRITRRHRWVWFLAWSLYIAIPADEVHAQVEAADDTGFSVERYTPPAGPTPFLGVEHADVMPHLQYSFGLASTFMTRPLVLRDVFDREVVSTPVSSRLGIELGGAIGLGRRYQVALALPVIAYQRGDRLRGIGLDERPLATTTLGDVRVDAKARLVGIPGARGLAVAAGLGLTLPTGDDGDFAGEGGTVVAFRMLGSWRRGWLVLGGELSARLRTQEVSFISPARPHGNEITTALGLAAHVPGTTGYEIGAVAEYAMVIGASGSSGIRGPSPGEFRVGARLALCTGWSVSAGAGMGVTPDDVGAPGWRVVGGLRYETSPLADIDRDGIDDGLDRCRLAAEDWDGFEDSDGCPDADNDGDGILDAADQCPERAEDFDGTSDADGCPDLQQSVQ